MYPSISGSLIVWFDVRNGNGDIYGAHSLSSNNECYSAIPVYKAVPYDGTTIGFDGIDASSCASNDSIDAWHSFTPDLSKDYSVSLCGSDYNTTLSIFDDCWGTQLSCNDNFCGTQSQVTFTAAAGQEYLIRVAGYNGQTGNYTLLINIIAECIDPPLTDTNDDCKIDLTDFANMSAEWLFCGFDDPDACWP
ncbi:MAG TPA: hypothetical protein ENH94_01305 [Phycisphaerales bacterium]|nr:hypothetical protein [Phycisphaerales bacterium]